jgi:hypothetical protein
MTLKLHLPVEPGTIITQRFGENPQDYRVWSLPGHEGIDFGAPSGSPVYAVADGVISFSGNSGPYGVHVTIQHDGFVSIYGHMSRTNTAAKQTVKAGEMIGAVGSTGNSTGPHLHLTLKVSGIQTGSYPAGIVDPYPYLFGLGGKDPVVTDPQPRSQPGAEAVREPEKSYPMAFAAKVHTPGDVLNIRTGPGTSYQVIGKAQDGETVQVTDFAMMNIWVEVGPGRFMAYRYNGKQFLEPIQ